MFAVNFKKDWRLNKSMFISFFTISLILFIVNIVFYLLISNLNLSAQTNQILNAIWMLLASLSSLLSKIFSIILIYFLLKKDLGKNNIHNTIFTPQSLLLWVLPKILYVFIIQGLFALLDIVYSYMIFDVAPILSPGQQINQFDWLDNIVAFLTTTFNFDLFALMTLWMALYYSFRKKGLSWLLIIITTFVYIGASQAFSIYQIIQLQLYKIEFKLIKTLLINYSIVCFVSIIFLIISFYLFEKKIEY